MIFCKSKIYAKVWNAELSESGKYMDLKISTSEKKEKEGEEPEFINSSWFARAVGHAVNSLKNITEGARIEITSAKLTNVYNKEKEKAYFNFVILEAKIAGDGETAPATVAAAKPEKVAEPISKDEDPF